MAISAPQNRTIKNPSPALLAKSEPKRRTRKIGPRTRSSASGRIERNISELHAQSHTKGLRFCHSAHPAIDLFAIDVV